MNKIGRLSLASAIALTACLVSSASNVAVAQRAQPASDATVSKCIHEVNRAQPYNPALGGDDKRRLNLYRACLRNGGQIPGSM